MAVVQSVAAPNVTWRIKGAITDQEVEFIQQHNPAVYHNDLECYLWAFDVKMPSGRWLENIRFNNAMTIATAEVVTNKLSPSVIDATVNISLMLREGETRDEAAQRLRELLAESLSGLADHQLDFVIEGWDVR